MSVLDFALAIQLLQYLPNKKNDQRECKHGFFVFNQLQVQNKYKYFRSFPFQFFFCVTKPHSVEIIQNVCVLFIYFVWKARSVSFTSKHTRSYPSQNIKSHQSTGKQSTDGYERTANITRF